MACRLHPVLRLPHIPFSRSLSRVSQDPSQPYISPRKAPAFKTLYRIPTPAEWQGHRKRMKELFPTGWNPPKKLSREAMDALRGFHAENSETFTTAMLAKRFKTSPEAVRRILKSQWTPPPERLLQIRKREFEVKERIQRERIHQEHDELALAVGKAKAVLDDGWPSYAAGARTEEEQYNDEYEYEERATDRHSVGGRKGATGLRQQGSDQREEFSRPRKETIEDRLRRARARAAEEESGLSPDIPSTSPYSPIAGASPEDMPESDYLRMRATPAPPPQNYASALPTAPRSSLTTPRSGATTGGRLRTRQRLVAQDRKSQEQQSAIIKARWEKRLAERRRLAEAKWGPRHEANQILQTRMSAIRRVAAG